MAKEIADIKEFLELIRRQDVNSATVKINKKLNKNGKAFRQTKFKLRGSRYLYTLMVNDAAKAKKLLQSLPPTFNVNKL